MSEIDGPPPPESQLPKVLPANPTEASVQFVSRYNSIIYKASTAVLVGLSPLNFDAGLRTGNKGQLAMGIFGELTGLGLLSMLKKPKKKR